MRAPQATLEGTLPVRLASGVEPGGQPYVLGQATSVGVPPVRLTSWAYDVAKTACG